MDNSSIAIKAININKEFRIGNVAQASIKESILNPFSILKQTTKFIALKDINLTIKKGDFVGIIGSNGSGKSTLLKIIAGIYKQDNGVIEVNGKLIPFLELGVGFNQELTAKENVYLNGTILGMTRKYLDGKMDDILSFAEIEKFANTPVKNFSSGMLLRLAFAIAIQSSADIYILDEVLAVGDARFQRKSREVIERFREEKKTILFVSHDLNTIQKYCNKVLWIEKSNQKYYGDTDYAIELYREEMFQKDLTIKKSENIKAVQQELKAGTLKLQVREVVVTYFNKKLIISAKIDKAKGDQQRNLAFGLYNSDNQNVFGISTKMDKFEIDKSAEKIVLEVDDIILRSDTYSINVAFFSDDETAPYHWQKDIAMFRVTETKGEFRGSIFLKHIWKTINEKG